jgi:hypothetical protein
MNNDMKSNLTIDLQKLDDNSTSFVDVMGTLSAEGFIIPNKAKALKYFGNPKFISAIVNVASVNDIDLNTGSDKIVQFQMSAEHNEDWNSYNGCITSNGYRFRAEDGRIVIIDIGQFIHYLPAKMFKEKHEGDHIKLHIRPYGGVRISYLNTDLPWHNKKAFIDITVDVLLNQTGHAAFMGTFEEVLARVTK